MLRLRTGTTVKGTDAAFPALSVTTTLCAPALATGMMRGQDTRLPAASAAHEVTRMPSKLTLRESDARKPWPLRLALVPTPPLRALRLMAGDSVAPTIPAALI
jgi:hypothetical protein